MKIEIDHETFKCKAYDELMGFLNKSRDLHKTHEQLTAVIITYILSKHCESEIERRFLMRGLWRIPGLLPQIEFERYRFDFGIRWTNVLIEVDGHDFHKTKEQRTRDAKRQRYLEQKGFRVIRFTGSEIYKDLDKCIQETEDALPVFVDFWQEFMTMLREP